MAIREVDEQGVSTRVAELDWLFVTPELPVADVRHVEQIAYACPCNGVTHQWLTCGCGHAARLQAIGDVVDNTAPEQIRMLVNIDHIMPQPFWIGVEIERPALVPASTNLRVIQTCQNAQECRLSRAIFASEYITLASSQFEPRYIEYVASTE